MQEKCSKKANMNIECTVMDCANHCSGQNYCSLEKIKVTTHETKPTVLECTDCSSFVLAGKDRK